MRKSKISIVKLVIIGFAMLMLGNSDVLAQVSVSLPILTRQQGSAPEWINLNVGNLTGQNVTSFEFTLSYNKSVIFIDSAIAGPVATGGLMAFNADTANQNIRVAYASASAFSGSGTLVQLKVHYVSLGTSPLAFNGTFKFNAGTPAANISEGSITIPAITISFSNLSTNKGDTIFIPINTSTLSSANNITAYQFAANFNAAKVHIINYSATGTLSSGGDVAINSNNTTGSVQVAFATTSAITGSGTLINLVAVAVDSGSSTQSFSSFVFNAGSPSAGTVSGILTINVIQTYKVSGLISYHNSAATPIPNATVTLLPASGNPVTVTTASDGSYSFTGLNAGTFKVSATASLTWGAVNATDALLAERSFLGLTTLDTVQLLGGDVNNDGQVNATDALDIINRYVGITNSFTKPDWIVFPASANVTITNANAAQNFSVLATGDINESYVVGAINKESSLNIHSNSSIKVKPSQIFEVPVSVSNNMVLGALSLKFGYNESFAKFNGISVAGDANIVSNVKDGVITLAWFDKTGGSSPLSLKSGSNIVNLKFTANSTVKTGDNFSIKVLAGSEFVDAQGRILSNSGISFPGIATAIAAKFLLSQNYPNPFNPSTTIEYSIASAGNVVLSIYNITGQEVGKVVNGFQDAGSHKAVWNASNLSSGIYFYKLNFNGSNNNYSEVKSMVLLK